LLVEDEASLRQRIANHPWHSLAIVVLEAATGVEARTVWEEHRTEIQLLLTDM